MSTQTQPPFAIQFCRAMKGVILAFKARNGNMSDSRLSRDIFDHSDGIKPIMNWDGVGRAPTLDTIRRIEDHLRLNFDADSEARSEELYQEILNREICAQRESLQPKP